mgnify:CR=1 FL=1
MGFSLLARAAGATPKTIPTRADTPNESITDQGVTDVEIK